MVTGSDPILTHLGMAHLGRREAQAITSTLNEYQGARVPHPTILWLGGDFR
jgi:hypothetical protein